MAYDPFDLESNKGNPIATIAEWCAALNDRERTKFKPGYSAYETAAAWAGPVVPEAFATVLAQTPLTVYRLRRVVVEATTRFDDFGEPRHHDLLATLRNNAGREAVVGIESKVNEDLGTSLTKELDRARNRAKRLNDKARAEGRPARHTTKMPERLRELSTALLGRDPPTGHPFVPEDADLAYQLLTALAGTLVEAARPEVDLAVLLVHEFHTSRSDPRVDARSSGRIQDLLTRFGRESAAPIPINRLLGPYHVLGGGRIPADKPFYVAKARTIVPGSDEPRPPG